VAKRRKDVQQYRNGMSKLSGQEQVISKLRVKDLNIQSEDYEDKLNIGISGQQDPDQSILEQDRLHSRINFEKNSIYSQNIHRSSLS
jgi:hypothetical protein